MRTSREIVPLTAMRGIAATAVVLYHFCQFSLPAGQPLSTLFQNVIGRGYLWVDFFFVLSGFVLAESHAADFARGFALRPYRDFLLRRLARVYPLYIVLSLAVLPLALGLPVLDSVFYHDPALPAGRVALWWSANVAMAQTWLAIPSVVPPAWSGSSEWAAYLFFPFLVIFVLRSRPATLLGCAGLAGAALVAVAASDPRGTLNVYASLGFPVLRCAAGFVLGLAAWRLASLPAVKRFTACDTAFSAVMAILALLFAFCGPDAPVALMFPFFVICAANNAGGLGRSRCATLGMAWRPFLRSLSRALPIAAHGKTHLRDDHRAPARGTWQPRRFRDRACLRRGLRCVAPPSRRSTRAPLCPLTGERPAPPPGAFACAGCGRGVTPLRLPLVRRMSWALR